MFKKSSNFKKSNEIVIVFASSIITSQKIHEKQIKSIKKAIKIRKRIVQTIVSRDKRNRDFTRRFNFLHESFLRNHKRLSNHERKKLRQNHINRDFITSRKYCGKKSKTSHENVYEKIQN